MSSLVNSLLQFMQQGGVVLWAILFATVLMWWLILERYLFLRFSFPDLRDELIFQWQHDDVKLLWEVKVKRVYLVSRATEQLNTHLPLIHTLTVVLPMLGLLGTVAGMIETFDVMSVFGTGNVRGMAAGISQALITTMAGLVAALSGFYFSANLEQRGALEKQRLTDKLNLERLGEML